MSVDRQLHEMFKANPEAFWDVVMSMTLNQLATTLLVYEIASGRKIPAGTDAAMVASIERITSKEYSGKGLDDLLAASSDMNIALAVLYLKARPSR